MWNKIQEWLGIGFLLFIGYAIFIEEPKNKGLPPSANPSYKQPAPLFTQPAQALPQTGANNASFGSGVAPLNIKTSSAGGYHYFVKIVNVSSGQELGSYFIRSGETLDINVPIGTYEIRYATGKIWYGPAYLFGPETSYSKADSLFTFNFDGYQYKGYTVELIMQSNGNLRTSGIEPSQW
jgi:hypothetical protein